MPDPLVVRAVLFDMDGTLVDSTAVVEAVWAGFADRFGLDLAEVLATAHGRRHHAPAGIGAALAVGIRTVAVGPLAAAAAPGLPAIVDFTPVRAGMIATPAGPAIEIDVG